MTIQSKPTTYTKVWASAGTKVSADDFKIGRGWEVEKPPYEMMNWLQNRQDQFLAHINQRGIASWDNAAEYKANVSYVTGATNGIVYRAVVDNTNVNPETDLTGKWVRAFDASQYAYSKAQSDAITAAERTTSNSLYLKVASNLSDLSNLATARNNLSVFSKTEVNSLITTERATSDGKYLQRSNNLSDLVNTATARTNLNVFSKTETYAKTETYSQTEVGNIFLSKADNLASLVDKSAARTNLDVYSKAETDAIIPAGAVLPFAMATAPTGWIPCDGRSLSRAAYPRLFSAIGTLYGSADSNSFNVPDYRGEFLRGFDAIGGTVRGVDSGRVFPQAQGSSLESHRHKMFSNAGSNRPALTADNYPKHSGTDGSVDSEYTINGVDSIEPTLGNSGSYGGSETRPRNMPVYFYIRA